MEKYIHRYFYYFDSLTTTLLITGDIDPITGRRKKKGGPGMKGKKETDGVYEYVSHRIFCFIFDLSNIKFQ